MLYKDFVREKSHHLTRIKSAEGYPCVFDKSKGKALKNYKVYGNSVQDGTPTPETPIEIESVGDLTTKNLLDVKAYFSDFLDYDGNMVYNQSNFTSIYSKLLLNNKFKENTRYTLSCTVEISNANNNGIILAFYDSNNTILSQSNCITTGSKTFKVKLTNNTNTTIKYVRIGYTTSGRRCDVKISNLQIEEGAIATEYEPYGKYKIPVAIVGKNILDINKKRIALKGSIPADNYSVENNVVSVQTPFYATADNIFGIKFNVKPSTLYTVSYTFITDRAKVSVFDMNGTCLKYSNYQAPFNFNSGGRTELLLEIRSNGWDILTQVSNIMIRETDTTTSDYVSYYDSLTITNIFLDAPLRKHSTYADYIDFKNQKVIRNVKERVLNGSENFKDWIYPEKMLGFHVWLEDGIGEQVIFCTHFKQIDGKLPNLLDEAIYMKWNELYIGTDNWSDASSFKQWLSDKYNSGEPVMFQYALATPTEEAITLPPILTQADYNIIVTTTNTRPSNIEVKYIAK